jgi:hypothetical protein
MPNSHRETSYLRSLCRHVLSYFALPLAKPRIVFSRRDQTILLAAAIFFQALYLLIIPLGFECDAAMYFRYAKTFIGAEGGGGAYYRAPGFPFFLVLSGQLLFGSFIPTVAAHAVMGVLSPLLFYRTLAPVGRTTAFIAAAAFILSTTPFFAAKLMLVEHLFAFLIVAGFYGFSRYYFTRDVRFLHLSLFCFFAATFTRWEANPLLFVGVIVFFFIARGRMHHLRHLALAVGLLAVLATSWSAARSYVIAGDMSLLGSFHNWAGRQSFWMVYYAHKPTLRGWEEKLGWRDPDETGLEMPPQFIQPPDYEGLWARPFVRLENGPNTKKLRDLIVAIMTEEPWRYRKLKLPMLKAYQPPGEPRRDFYHESFGQFDGKPQVFADNFFANANGYYTDFIPHALKQRIGLVEMDRLLGAVVLETVAAKPVLIPLFMIQAGSNLLTLFGFNLGGLIDSVTSESSGLSLPFMTIWGKSMFSDVYYNIGGCAEAHLTPAMRQEIITDHEITIPLRDRLFSHSDWLRSLVRNLGGTIALLCMWFLPFMGERRFALCLAALILPYLVFGAALAYGAIGRYEVAVQPLILMLAFCGILGIAEIIRNKAG